MALRMCATYGNGGFHTHVGPAHFRVKATDLPKKPSIVPYCTHRNHSGKWSSRVVETISAKTDSREFGSFETWRTRKFERTARVNSASMGSERKDEVVLFNHPMSHFGQRVHIALVEKGIPFKSEFPDLRNKPKELTDVNPIYGKVPSMVHNGTPILESLIILEYLDEQWPETWQLLPKDAVGRAKARFWADFIYKGFTSMMHAVKSAPESPEHTAAAEEIKKFVKTLDGPMNEYSKEGPFFTGHEFGYLDVVLAPFLCWSVVVEKAGGVTLPGPDEAPRLYRWMKDVTARKSVKDTLPSGEEVANFYLSIKKKVAAAANAAAASPAS